MAGEKKKVTRVMRVTMDEEEFDKFDRGETHSDSGLRNEAGRLSALPDIAPVEETDLPERKVVVYQDRYLGQDETTIGQKLAAGVAQTVVEILCNPEVQEAFCMLASTFWHYKAMPKIQGIISKMNGENQPYAKAERILEKEHTKAQNVVDHQEISQLEEAIPNDENSANFIVNEEQAQMLVTEARKKAKELSAMIFLLSNLCIKDEKSDEERVIEQSYIKRLVSEEAHTTMKLLIENRQLDIVDEETVRSFDIFLKGYLRNGEQLIPVPLDLEQKD